MIWQVDNRGSTGRGHAFETPIYHRMGKIELADQLEGIQYLIAQGFVDPARVGIYGWSYGGYMTLYSLLNAPEVFRAGIAGAPVTNWRNYDTIYTERYLGLPSETRRLQGQFSRHLCRQAAVQAPDGAQHRRRQCVVPKHHADGAMRSSTRTSFSTWWFIRKRATAWADRSAGSCWKRPPNSSKRI